MANSCLRIEDLRKINQDAKFLIKYSMADLMPIEENKKHVHIINQGGGFKAMWVIDYQPASSLGGDEDAGTTMNFAEDDAYFRKHQHEGTERFQILKGEMHLKLHDENKTVILNKKNPVFTFDARQVHSARFVGDTLYYAFTQPYDKNWPKPLIYD